jgi:hypothetical protein
MQGGLSSGEGLIRALSDDEDNDKRLLVIEPEFAFVLQVMVRNTICAMLRQAWDSGDIRTLSREPLHASGTHISLIGHITKDELRKRMDTTEAANGFGNRILWACATRSKMLPHGGNLHADTMAGLAESFKEVLNWLESQQCPVRLTWDDHAKALWESVYPQLSEGKVGMFGAVTSRAEAYVVRLSLIFAVLDRSLMIGEDHLLAAIAVWEYCESSARFIFGDASGNPVADAILNGRGVARPSPIPDMGAKVCRHARCLAEAAVSRTEMGQSRGCTRAGRREYKLGQPKTVMRVKNSNARTVVQEQ